MPLAAVPFPGVTENLPAVVAGVENHDTATRIEHHLGSLTAWGRDTVVPSSTEVVTEPLGSKPAKSKAPVAVRAAGAWGENVGTAPLAEIRTHRARCQRYSGEVKTSGTRLGLAVTSMAGSPPWLDNIASGNSSFGPSATLDQMRPSQRQVARTGPSSPSEW
jgi:hypothetical protein